MVPSLVTQILFNAEGMTQDGSHGLRAEVGQRGVGFKGQIFLMHPDTPAAVEWPRARREWIDCGGWKIWFWRQGYGRCVFIGQTFQPCGVLSEQRGVEAGFQIGAADEVGFAAGMSTGHPPPGEGVGRGIGIEQVLEEKVSAEFPGKPFVMDPPSGDPEARVVMEPSGLEQFTDEVIHDGDAGAAGGDVG